MLKSLRRKTALNERLFFIGASFVLIAVIFVNANTLRSFFVGISALGFYLFLNGRMLGRTLFGEENGVSRLVLGLILFVSLMGLMGIGVQLVFEPKMWYLCVMLVATITTFVINHFLGINASNEKSDEKSFFRRPYTIPVYFSYGVLVVLSFFLVLNARSGWIEGPIWKVISPMFLHIYFIATVALGAIVLLPGKVTLRLLCIVLHSIFSLSLVIIVLYPGILYYDPWYTLAKSQESTMVIYAQGMTGYFDEPISVRALNTLLKGRVCYVFIATFADILCIDRYWTTATLVPILWGLFTPLMAYKITEKIGGSKGTSILAAFLTIPNLYFLAWGKSTTAASLGNLFFIPFVYFMLQFISSDEPFSVRYLFSSRGIKAYFPVFISFASLVTLHFLPMVLATSFVVLAFALKKYRLIKTRFPGNLLLFSSFTFSTFILPFCYVGRGILIPEIGTCAFSVENVLNTSIWTLVFGFSEEIPIQDAMFQDIFAWLGLIGFVYALQRKKVFNKTLCLFLFLAFGVCLIDYRILEYAIVGDKIFGPGRVNVFREIVALPFASVVMMSSAKALFGSPLKVRSRLRWRTILAGLFVCFSLSALTTATVYETYEYYTRGLLATSLEVEAIRFIDEHTNGRYVVLAPHPTTVIGHGLLGYPNPEKMYYSIGLRGAPSEPSVASMVDLMETTEADVGYFVASFRSKNLNKTVAEASKIFGLFKIVNNENGQIYIFDYKIPPLPTSADVMAFYWEAPSAYYVQNDLMRILINPTTKTLDTVDFWGDLYQTIDLEKALVDGNPVGDLVSVEYHDAQTGKWVDWDPETEIPPAEQFKFRLGFEEDSLVGLLERGKPSVDLEWESGRAFSLNFEVGDFTRLYIPGLIGGKDSYDTNSREYGFLYTTTLTDNIVLQPALRANMSSASLTFSEIKKYCNFTLNNYMWYDLYVQNNAYVDQWAFIEVWLPDTVYVGTFPPFSYSVDDGRTWVRPRFDVETGGPVPVRTLGGVDVNWIVTKPRIPWEEPTPWWTYTKANGGYPELLGNYTDSGGAQNRIIFGVYLPARDRVLLRLGSAVYYVRPLTVGYVFRNSDNAYYGLHNMEQLSIKLYSLDQNAFVGGLEASQRPTSLVVVEDEDGKMHSLRITLPTNTRLSLFGEKDVDTTQDLDDDGVPDLVR
jgi:hypothetical protein